MPPPGPSTNNYVVRTTMNNFTSIQTYDMDNYTITTTATNPGPVGMDFLVDRISHIKGLILNVMKKYNVDKFETERQ